MDTPADPIARPAASRGGEEDIFDRYFDAALSGEPPPPEVFLEGLEVSDELRERIVAIHAEYRRKADDAPDPAPDGESGGGGGAGLPFEWLGPYRILRRLDEGGMGTVFLAEHEPLGRTVALKVVRAEFRDSAAAAARFDREMQALARLRHPNIVTVHDAGRDRGVRYLAMEYVEGRDLTEVLADEGRLPPARVVRWGARLAGALAEAHTRGIVHRDVKPSNVRITPEGEPVLLDFGVARADGQEGLTMSGPFVGTPLYAAPEQIREAGRDVDARADVYGLGATLYECVTGRTPVTGGTLEQVLHRVLHETPMPPRRLAPAITRDLEVVLMTALEKDPARRYASAAALAEDLAALLEMRPIRARPPGPWRRLRGWARRHRGLASGIAALLLSALVVAGYAVAAGRAAARQRKRDARAVLEAAREKLAGLAPEPGMQILEKRISNIERWRESHYIDDGMEREHRESADRVARRRIETERGFYEVLELLRRAERLDPELPGVDDARAHLFLERWREADRRERNPEAAYFRRAALDHDRDGSVREALFSEERLTLITDPAGAEVHLFQYRLLADLVPRGDRRLVPVPRGGFPDGAAAGGWAFRVVKGTGTLAPEDVVLEVDGARPDATSAAALRRRVEAGGATARVWRSGGAETLVLPRGLAVRVTAAPLLPTPASRLGLTPITEVALAPGSWLMLVRAPGHEPQRVVFALAPDAGNVTRLDVRLHPEGTTPEGFVFVEGAGTSAQGVDRPVAAASTERRGFWIMEREVTAAEYLGFLNAPDGPESGGAWPRGADGRYRLPDGIRSADWPALFVSFDEATAYAAWRTRRSRAAGGRLVFALPTYAEWVTAGEGSADRSYPFGPYFWPHWVNSCFSRPKPAPEPVLSYPVDESPFGVFDLSGSAAEWCDAWWGSGRSARRLGGASWAQARIDLFKVTGGSGAAPETADREIGFRLVARPAGDRGR